MCGDRELVLLSMDLGSGSDGDPTRFADLNVRRVGFAREKRGAKLGTDSSVITDFVLGATRCSPMLASVHYGNGNASLGTSPFPRLGAHT